MSVVTVIEHAGSALVYIDKEQERQPQEGQPLLRAPDRESRCRLWTDADGQLEWRKLLGRGFHLREPVPGWLCPVHNAGLFRALFGEQVEVVIKQLHLLHGLVDSAGAQREGLTPNDSTLIRWAREVARPMCGLRLMTPFMRINLRTIASFSFPVSGNAFEPTPQSCLESIDGFPGGLTLDLSADEPAVDIQVGLADHRAVHRRIGLPAQPDTGMKHGLVREPTEPTDPFPCIVINAGQLTMRRHLDVESW